MSRGVRVARRLVGRMHRDLATSLYRGAHKSKGKQSDSRWHWRLIESRIDKDLVRPELRKDLRSEGWSRFESDESESRTQKKEEDCTTPGSGLRPRRHHRPRRPTGRRRRRGPQTGLRIHFEPGLPALLVARTSLRHELADDKWKTRPIILPFQDGANLARAGSDHYPGVGNHSARRPRAREHDAFWSV